MDSRDKLIAAINAHVDACVESKGEQTDATCSTWVDLLEGIKAIEHPSRPAIPEDVRNTIAKCIDAMDDRAFRSQSLCEGQLKLWELARDKARAWLAQCPTATDKAVCPKCGNSARISLADAPTNKVWCCDCKAAFPIQVLVISPPRASKVNP